MSPAHSPHPAHCHRPRSWAIAILLAAGSLSCDDDDPFTAQPPAAAIVKIAGDEQAGRVSQELPNPLVVRVLDGDSGLPVSGVSVTWVAQGGGSVSPETVPTDPEGLASAQRVLGPTAGTQTTTAAVSGFQDLQVTFTSSALVEE